MSSLYVCLDLLEGRLSRLGLGKFLPSITNQAKKGAFKKSAPVTKGLNV